MSSQNNKQNNVQKKQMIENSPLKYYKYIDDDDFEIDNMIKKSITQKKYEESLKNIFNSLNEKQTAKEKNDKFESLDEVSERLKMTRETADVFLENAKSDRKWKNIYAKILLIILIIQILSVNIIFILVGFSIMNYSDSTFNIFITGTLIEIIAVIRLVVKYLFSDNISATFDKVLEKNKKKNL